MFTTRSVTVSLVLCTTAYLQFNRWKHARLMQTLLNYDTIGYQIPGGLFVAPKHSDADTDPKRVFIDLKCQAYRQDDRLSEFTPKPYWFRVHFSGTPTESQT